MNNDDNLKNKFIIAAFLAVLGGFALLNRLVAPPEISMSERRHLATMPAFSAASVSSGRFMKDFENFAADSFVFRDNLRAAHTAFILGVYLQSDKSGLYVGRFGAGKLEKIDETSVRQAAAKILKLASSIDDARLYYSFIPDKNVYAGRYMPGFDVERARLLLGDALAADPRLTYVDVAGALSAADFYRTDLHWSQPRLGGVVSALGAGMGFRGGLEGFTEEPVGLFQGVYSGQLALPLKPDLMSVMTDGPLHNATASYLDPQSQTFVPGDIYDFAAVSGRDPYDVFLKGVQPLIILENPDAPAERELYLFRDSFGSSLAPLLLAAYSKVVLIDLRYIDSRLLAEHAAISPGADVLFLYSSQILNSASVLLAG
ncbi:MAG: hypothetical protein LBG71_08255 [Clostridiales Family XIII bacterium]|jgi:hypothetical protein|nr:hypothetical protein [Clostridiales Family XIII bacterium]